MKDTSVEIFGGVYTVRGDEDPAYVRQLAAFVDEKMRAAARKSPAAGAHRIAVLAALNMADELFKLKRRQRDVDSMIIEKTGSLFDLLQEEE